MHLWFSVVAFRRADAVLAPRIRFLLLLFTRLATFLSFPSTSSPTNVLRLPPTPTRTFRLFFYIRLTSSRSFLIFPLVLRRAVSYDRDDSPRPNAERDILPSLRFIANLPTSLSAAGFASRFCAGSDRPLVYVVNIFWWYFEECWVPRVYSINRISSSYYKNDVL